MDHVEPPLNKLKLAIREVVKVGELNKLELAIREVIKVACVECPLEKLKPAIREVIKVAYVEWPLDRLKPAIREAIKVAYVEWPRDRLKLIPRIFISLRSSWEKTEWSCKREYHYDTLAYTMYLSESYKRVRVTLNSFLWIVDNSVAQGCNAVHFRCHHTWRHLEC